MKVFNVVNGYVFDDKCKLIVKYVNDIVTYETLERLYGNFNVVLFS